MKLDPNQSIFLTLKWIVISGSGQLGLNDDMLSWKREQETILHIEKVFYESQKAMEVLSPLVPLLHHPIS